MVIDRVKNLTVTISLKLKKSQVCKRHKRTRFLSLKKCVLLLELSIYVIDNCEIVNLVF